MKIFVTRKIPNRGIEMLRSAGHEIVIRPHDRGLTPDALISGGTGAEAVLAHPTVKVTRDDWAAGKRSVRIIANYAVGYDNIDVAETKELGIVVTNTPDVLTETVAEHAFALMLSIA